MFKRIFWTAALAAISTAALAKEPAPAAAYTPPELKAEGLYVLAVPRASVGVLDLFVKEDGNYRWRGPLTAAYRDPVLTLPRPPMVYPFPNVRFKKESKVGAEFDLGGFLPMISLGGCFAGAKGYEITFLDVTEEVISPMELAVPLYTTAPTWIPEYEGGKIREKRGSVVYWRLTSSRFTISAFKGNNVGIKAKVNNLPTGGASAGFALENSSAYAVVYKGTVPLTIAIAALKVEFNDDGKLILKETETPYGRAVAEFVRELRAFKMPGLGFWQTPPLAGIPENGGAPALSPDPNRIPDGEGVLFETEPFPDEVVVTE